MDEIKLELSLYEPDNIMVNGIRYIIVSSEVDEGITYNLQRYDKYLEKNTIKKDTN